MTDIPHPLLSAGHAGPKISSERNFGLVFAGVFALISLSPLIHANQMRVWPLPIAAVFLAAAILAPRALAPLNRLWFLIGILLGKIVTPLVMTMLFFVVVTPVGVVMRLCGNDPLRLKRDRAAKSYWLDRPLLGPTTESFKDQF